MIESVGRVGSTTRVSSSPSNIEAVSGFGDSLEALLRAPSAKQAALGADVQFSKHAQARMSSRGIDLDNDDLEDLRDAVDKLASRGARESLVLLGDNAFIVGVPGRKVVTALTRHEAAGNVFTQIDSTIVIR
jgi:flagellar operon protein